MPNLNKNYKLAKDLLVASLNSEGRVEKAKVESILNELKKLPRTKSLQILHNFYFLVRQKIKTYEANLDIASSNSEVISNTLNRNLRASSGNTIDIISSRKDSLISGFRLRIGDDVYEDSIQNRLNRLKKSLS